MRDCPWLDWRGTTQLLEAHRAGAADLAHEVWSLFVFALWYERLAVPAAREAPDAGGDARR
jgi:hypothetical protein